MDNNNNEQTTAVATIDPPEPPAPLIIKTKDGKLFRHIDVDGFDGFAEFKVPPPAYPEGTPYIHWTGPKFPLAAWHRILAFFEWSYQEHKSEAQVRLYVNLQTGDAMAWAFPQRCVGMTTEELGSHPDWPENEAMVRGYDQIGTVHHHCSSGAFQSGTDRNDEKQANGLHITVGHIGTDTYDLHTRVILNGNSQEADLTQWFEMPVELLTLPPLIECFRDSMFLGLLRMPPPENWPFPEMWRHNVKNYSTVVRSGNWRDSWTPGGTYMGPAAPPTGKVETSRPRVVGEHNRNHSESCMCIMCQPLTPPKGGHNGPFAGGVSSNGTPGPGAGKNDVDVTDRVRKALKKVAVQAPDATEEPFMTEAAELIEHYNISEERALELFCLMLVGENISYHPDMLIKSAEKALAIDEKNWQEELEEERMLAKAARELDKEALRRAYGDEAADQLHGGGDYNY